MIKKYTAFIPFLMISGILFTGCRGANDKTTGPAQTPQAQNKEQEDINKALKELLPPSAEYLTSKNARQKQSIYLEDIKKDGNKEAFVLYRNPKDNQQAHLLLLTKQNESWKKAEDISTGFSDFDYFDLLDLDGNGIKEVIAGGGSSDTEPEKQLHVYELLDGGLKEKVNRAYESIDISDYDDDTVPDILILSGERNIKQTAELFSYKEGQLKSRSQIELNPDGLHENIVFGKLADGEKALFIDSSLGAHSMLTEIVAYEKGELKKIGDESDGVLWKAYPLYSRDINGDGIIEAGGMYIPKGYEDAAMAEIPFLFTYNDYSINGSNKTIEERYSDNSHHFYVTLPSNLYGKITIKRMENGVQLVSTDNSRILFTVKWMRNDAGQIPGTKLGETEDTVFYSDLNVETPIPNDHFHLLEEELD